MVHLLDTPRTARIIFRVQTNGPIAQLVEQLTLNQRVAGSSPARLTIIRNDVTAGANYHLPAVVVCAQLGMLFASIVGENDDWFTLS